MNYLKSFTCALILPSLLLLTTAPPVSADEPSLIPPSGTLGGGCNFITGQFKASCAITYIQYLIGIIFMLIGAAFFFMIIVAGYRWTLGSASIGEKEAGKKQLQSAIIGFIISALAFFIIDFIISSLAYG